MNTQETIKQKIKTEIIAKIKCISDYSDKIRQCNQLLADIVTNYEDTELNEHTINDLYGEIPGKIFGLSEAYFSILLSGWNLLNELQVKNNSYVYRASIAAYLTMNYRLAGDRGATYRWALLTEAENLLDKQSHHANTGKEVLTSEFGFDDIAIEKLASISKENLTLVDDQRNWRIPEAFSEDAVTKFAFLFPEYSMKFGLATKIEEYEINPHYFGSLLNKINEQFSNTTQKGNSLEQLATYLFLLIPGLVPRRNLLEETIAFESDIVVRNLNRNANLISDMFGRFILSECKNWEKTVTVKEVGYFLFRMRLTHSHFGVLFAKNGITGDPAKETAARSLIRKTFHEDGNICIVIDETILQMIHHKSISFLSCMMLENEKVRFGTEK